MATNPAEHKAAVELDKRSLTVEALVQLVACWYFVQSSQSFACRQSADKAYFEERHSMQVNGTSKGQMLEQDLDIVRSILEEDILK